MGKQGPVHVSPSSAPSEYTHQCELVLLLLLQEVDLVGGGGGDAVKDRGKVRAADRQGWWGPS